MKLGIITLYPEIAPINMLLLNKYNLTLENYKDYTWPSEPPVKAFKADVCGSQEDFINFEKDLNTNMSLYEYLLNKLFNQNFTLENATVQLEEILEKVKRECH
jgi:hypothetical protein